VLLTTTFIPVKGAPLLVTLPEIVCAKVKEANNIKKNVVLIIFLKKGGVREVNLIIKKYLSVEKIF
jgi:hypothetical protein